MPRELVAKRRSESNRVTATVEQCGQLIVGSRDETLEGGNGWLERTSWRA